MDRLSKLQTAPRPRSDTVRNLPALAERHDLVTVPAAWPTGVSQLAQAIDACQRREPGQVGMDWQGRAPAARDYLTT